MKWLRLIDTFLQHGLTGPGASAAWQAFRQRRHSSGLGMGSAAAWGASTSGMRWGGYGRRSRPSLFRPFRWIFSLFWTLFWVFFGLSFAFVPEFRNLFIRLPFVVIHWLRDFWQGALGA